MENRLNILCASSDLYSPFCGVMLESLFYNNKDFEQIKVYLVSDGIGEENLKKFEELGAKYGRVIEIFNGYEISKRLEDFKIPRHNNSYASYYKLVLPIFLHEDISRIIYLDCDLIINGSLRELYETDLGDNVLGMTSLSHCELTHKMCGNLSGNLFNGGMVLIDLKKWRAENYTDRVIDYVSKCSPLDLVFIDEGVIDIVVKKVKHVNYKFNTVIAYLEVQQKGGIKLLNKMLMYHFSYTDEEWNNAFETPVIVHYVSAEKPWFSNTTVLMVDVWDKYLEMSPWHDYQKKECKRPVSKKIRMVLYKILPVNIFAVVNRKCTELFFINKVKKIKKGKM